MSREFRFEDLVGHRVEVRDTTGTLTHGKVVNVSPNAVLVGDGDGTVTVIDRARIVSVRLMGKETD